MHLTPSALLPWLWIFYVNGRHAELLHQLSLKQTLYCFHALGTNLATLQYFFPIAVINHKQWNHSTVKEERKGELERDMIRESFGLPAVMYTQHCNPNCIQNALFAGFIFDTWSHKCGGVTLKLSSCSSSRGINSQNHCFTITLEFVNFRVLNLHMIRSKDCCGLSNCIPVHRKGIW